MLGDEEPNDIALNRDDIRDYVVDMMSQLAEMAEHGGETKIARGLRQLIANAEVSTPPTSE